MQILFFFFLSKVKYKVGLVFGYWKSGVEVGIAIKNWYLAISMGDEWGHWLGLKF